MSELGDTFRGMKEEARARRSKLEGGRTDNATKEFEAWGWKVEDGPDEYSVRVTTKNGTRLVFYPWSGWYQGSGFSGRGLDRLFSDLKKAGDE